MSRMTLNLLGEKDLYVFDVGFVFACWKYYVNTPQALVNTNVSKTIVKDECRAMLSSSLNYVLLSTKSKSRGK